jgi:RNA polymerase sigma-70 factor (ECF subfamily)
VTTDTRALFDVRLQQCAQSLARGGIGALGPLFDLVADRLLRYARLFTRHEQDAEDVLQSALMRTAVHPEGLAGAAYPWAYLIRTVRNEALRVVDRRPTTQPAWTVESEGQWADDEDGTWPAAAIEQEELRSAVRDALAALPSEQSEVLVLKLWEELTFAEIATVCEASPNTVASRYRYALDKLAPQLSRLREDGLSDGTEVRRRGVVVRAGGERLDHE